MYDMDYMGKCIRMLIYINYIPAAVVIN